MTTHLHTTRIDSLEGRNALLPVLNDWSKELVTIQARVPKNDIRQKALSNLNDMIKKRTLLT
jgi:hypothetical protein